MTPGPNEPRATLRLTKDISGKDAGTSSEETIHVGLVEVTSSDYPITPGASRVEYAGVRYHFEEHYVRKEVLVSDSCASHDVKGNCVEKSHYEMQTVLVRTKVEDGRCNASASYAFVEGATYDLRLAQSALRTCSITCEQVGVGPCATLAHDAPARAPATEHYEPSMAHQAGYPVTAIGITGVAVGLGWMIANRGDSSISKEHCPNDECDAIGKAEADQTDKAQLPGKIMLLGGIGATVGGLLLLNVSGRWVKNGVSVGAASDRVMLSGTF